MIVDKKLNEAYEQFCELRSTDCEDSAFRGAVRPLMVEKPEETKRKSDHDIKLAVEFIVSLKSLGLTVQEILFLKENGVFDDD